MKNHSERLTAVTAEQMAQLQVEADRCLSKKLSADFMQRL
jgi:hypothetical protein